MFSETAFDFYNFTDAAAITCSRFVTVLKNCHHLKRFMFATVALSWNDYEHNALKYNWFRLRSPLGETLIRVVF